ncbi:MAG: WD40 repeat domain-containing protein, partial [Candidatus Aminicenantes bacterium]|nr:WD40 repeat domain-containing protein [Candidatus Aminicenantes bacterium]
MPRARILVWSVLALCLAAGAVVPRQWTLRSFDEFLRGKFDGIALSSDGRLSLSAPEEKIDGPAEDFYLSFQISPEGVGYLGTGHGGTIYRIDKEGKAEVYFEAPEMDVTCLVLDPKGILYAGTSPNGKIYKITAAGKGEELFNPAERYIWDLVLADNGNLLAAVGENGGIYEINPQGQGRQVFKAEQNHLLCLRFDRNGDIIAGSGGPGLIYRIAKNGGRGTVIFETPFEEVRSLAYDLDGNLYASAGGTVKSARAETVSETAPVTAGNVEVDVSVSAAPVRQAGVPSAPSTGSAAARLASAGREPGAIFRIDGEGMARSIWMSSEEQVYSLFWNEAEKKVFFGTGPKGRLYTIDRAEKTALLLQGRSEQIYACVPVGTRLYLLANNPSGLSRVSADRRLEGDYLGPVWDARLVSSWGRLRWEADVPAEGLLRFQSRSGNTAEPGSSWSDWSPPYEKADGEQILSPRARYLQVRAMFKSTSVKSGPMLSRVDVPFLPVNAAPEISRIELLEPNEVFLKPPDMDEAVWGLERRQPESPKKADETRMMVAKKVERQGFRTLVWSGTDDNGDDLVYTISLRKDGEQEWRTVEDRWTEEIFAFNTVYYPDGRYEMNVSVSDERSNPPGREKKGEKTVGPLIIDNTAPSVDDLKAVRQGGRLQVSFQALDALSTIKDVRVLIRPGEWTVVYPEDGIADSKAELYSFTIPLPAGADNLLTVLVRD